MLDWKIKKKSYWDIKRDLIFHQCASLVNFLKLNIINLGKNKQKLSTKKKTHRKTVRISNTLILFTCNEMKSGWWWVVKEG